MKIPLSSSELLQAYFTDRLMKECNASPHTIANYRDTFRLLIAYAQRRLKKLPTLLAIEDLDASLILGFLDYLERERGNSPRSRNVRLGAIHSFFGYVALQEPTLGARKSRWTFSAESKATPCSAPRIKLLGQAGGIAHCCS
jgi:integrase/recombinase XerD